MTWSDVLSWSYWVHSSVGGMHFANALLALLLGPFVFLRRKGTKFHRVAGYIWVLSMLSVNITALSDYSATGGPNIFHFFALWSLSALLPGFYAIQRAVRTNSRHYLELHIRLMVWAYFGLAAAGFSQLMSRALVPVLEPRYLIFILIGAVIGTTSMVLGNHLRKLVPKLADRYHLDRPTPSAPLAGETQ